MWLLFTSKCGKAFKIRGKFLSALFIALEKTTTTTKKPTVGTDKMFRHQMKADRTNKIRTKDGVLLCSGGWVNYISETYFTSILCKGLMVSNLFCNCCLEFAE